MSTNVKGGVMVKKQLIMEKAFELFAKNGIEATSVQQITEVCGISKGAFYLSYKSKDELVFALIDYFLSDMAANIEQSVSESHSSETLLYHFYYTIFNAYQSHSNFAKVLIKEQFNSCSMEIFEQLSKYDHFLNSIIFSIIDRQFPDVDDSMRPDLVYTIKCFSKMYAELFFITNYPFELDRLCDSLVEKVTILAKQTTIPLISSEYLSYTRPESLVPSKEELVNLLTMKKDEITDQAIQQSLELLKNDLLNPEYPEAIIHGLLKNLKSNSHSKWTAYLYEQYVKSLD
jgi:AcrR family transcriptional regulator